MTPRPATQNTRDNPQEDIVSLTIKHPNTDFTGEHSGLTFTEGTAELSELEDAAREPLIANGFTIDGENDVAETPTEKAERLAQEADAARIAAEAAAEAAAEEAKRAAEEKAAAEKAAAEKAAAKTAAKK